MLKEMEPRRKTIQCQLSRYEDSTGITISSSDKNDTKLAKILAHYSCRGHNIYPIYEDDIVDNVTIDDDINNTKKIKAFFVTKFALKQQHKCENDIDIE